MRYYLKWENEIVAPIILDANGNMEKFSERTVDKKLAPIAYKSDPRWLKIWWNERAVPISQGRVAEMLRDRAVAGPKEYLLKNLGLSLTDHYWVCPVDMNLKWEEVNLFNNDFDDNIITKYGKRKAAENGTSSFSPNSSLQGELEKSWAIRNGRRILIKGNHGKLSSESINEVLAALLHKKQGYKNYVEYKLIRIKGQEYDYGCYSNAFTSERYELVSAWDLMTSETKPNNISAFEHLMNVIEKYEMDPDYIRSEIQYEILADYVMSNRDRHMNNIGFLRDAKMFKFVGMAPIFDNGKSMFAGMEVPNIGKLAEQKTNSFAPSEEEMLRLVDMKNAASLLDISKLPDADEVKELYSKDSKIEEARINSIVNAYEEKIKLLESHFK